jgi:hypothetical protein
MRAIELSDAECKVLTAMISKEIEETRVELHHTKDAEFREFLKEQEDVLKGLLKRLG